MVHEFVRAFGLSSVVSDDYFADIAQRELEVGRFAEAAICIANSKLFSRFDCLELCVDLVDIGRVGEAKMILNQVEELRAPVVKRLSAPKYAKTATKFVIDYEMNS